MLAVSPADIKALRGNTDIVSCSFFVAPHLDSWVSTSGRVLLIGDAAHAIPPTGKNLVYDTSKTFANCTHQLRGGQGAAMALEDAETLAYTLAEPLVPLKQDETEQSRLSSLTSKWNAHRHARVAKVVDFTTKGGALRKSSPHFYEQAAKEWIIWAAFKWMGSEGGAQWMYEYSAENVRADLV